MGKTMESPKGVYGRRLIPEYLLKLLEKLNITDLPVKETVTNIKQLTQEQFENLKCGDIVVKEDSAGKHAYIVAYKKEDEMSLVYADAHNVEEVYYEKSGTTWAWVVTENTPIEQMNQDVETLKTSKQDTLVSSGDDQNIKTINNESLLGSGNISIPIVAMNPTPTGTEEEISGIEVDGVKYKLPASSVHLYQHNINIYNNDFKSSLTIINSSETSINTFALLLSALDGKGNVPATGAYPTENGYIQYISKASNNIMIFFMPMYTTDGYYASIGAQYYKTLSNFSGITDTVIQLL